MMLYYQIQGTLGDAEGTRYYLFGPQLEAYESGTIRRKAAPYRRTETWSHTRENQSNPDGLFWSWTPEGKWELQRESEISVPEVLRQSHVYNFPIEDPDTKEDINCLLNQLQAKQYKDDIKIDEIKNKYMKEFEVEFDTRNFTQYNNYEHQDIIPVPDEFHKLKAQVHDDSTEYFLEVMFIPPTDKDKFFLVESVQLQDLTMRDMAAIPTGYGIETSGVPLRKFVEEDKIYLNKEQVRDVLKFYNGLAGLGEGQYATNLQSRDATITSGTLEVSGGSRLNYRLHPQWGEHTIDGTLTRHYNYSKIEVDN